MFTDEQLKRLCKYTLLSLSVGMAVQHIPENAPNDKDTAMIAMVAGITFAIIEMYAPAVSQTLEPGDNVGVKRSE